MKEKNDFFQDNIHGGGEKAKLPYQITQDNVVDRAISLSGVLLTLTRPIILRLALRCTRLESP